MIKEPLKHLIDQLTNRVDAVPTVNSGVAYTDSEIAIAYYHYPALKICILKLSGTATVPTEGSKYYDLPAIIKPSAQMCSAMIRDNSFCEVLTNGVVRVMHVAKAWNAGQIVYPTV